MIRWSTEPQAHGCESAPCLYHHSGEVHRKNATDRKKQMEEIIEIAINRNVIHRRECSSANFCHLLFLWDRRVPAAILLRALRHYKVFFSARRLSLRFLPCFFSPDCSQCRGSSEECDPVFPSRRSSPLLHDRQRGETTDTCDHIGCKDVLAAPMRSNAAVRSAIAAKGTRHDDTPQPCREGTKGSASKRSACRRKLGPACSPSCCPPNRPLSTFFLPLSFAEATPPKGSFETNSLACTTAKRAVGAPVPTFVACDVKLVCVGRYVFHRVLGPPQRPQGVV
jgi:hypothetical protein